MVHRFRQLYPEVELALTEATSDAQIASLLEGKGHVGIIIAHGEAILPDTLRYRKLASEPLVAAVPESWLEEGRLTPIRKRLTSAAVISSPLVVFPRRAAPSFDDPVTGYYTACGGKAHIAQYAFRMQAIISLVSAGIGIALVPASLRNLARSGVHYLELEGDAPQLETGIIWCRDDRTPTLGNFLRMLERDSVLRRLITIAASQSRATKLYPKQCQSRQERPRAPQPDSR